MDQEELHTILKKLYSSFTSSSSPFSSDMNIITPVVPRFIYNIQDSTCHSQESFSQQNNINQTNYDGIDLHLHNAVKGFGYPFPTSSSTTLSKNAYNSQNLTFQRETSWPPLLSEYNRTRTYDNNNWDLHDFVKSFDSGVDTSTATKATTNTNIVNTIGTNTPTVHVEPYIPHKPIVQREENNVLQHNHADIIEELIHDPFDPFDFPKLKIPHILHISSAPPCFVLKGSQDLSYHNNHHQFLHGKSRSPGIPMSTSATTKSTIRSTKRKNQMKLIYQVPFEEKLSTRYWRKYGQKPIKGSPYPRGYYRCSALESCIARKRVERKKNDPRVLIITYTGIHNHPPPPFEDLLRDTKSQNKYNYEKNSISSLDVSPTTNELVKTKIVKDARENITDENVSYEAMDDDVFETLAEIVDLSDGES